MKHILYFLSMMPIATHCMQIQNRPIATLASLCSSSINKSLDAAYQAFEKIPAPQKNNFASTQSYLHQLTLVHTDHPAFSCSINELSLKKQIPQPLYNALMQYRLAPIDHLYEHHTPFQHAIHNVCEFLDMCNQKRKKDSSKYNKQQFENDISNCTPSAFHSLIKRLLCAQIAWKARDTQFSLYSGFLQTTNKDHAICAIELTKNPEWILVAQNTALTRLNLITKEFKRLKKYDFLCNFNALSSDGCKAIYRGNSHLHDGKDLYVINLCAKNIASIQSGSHVVAAVYNQDATHFALGFNNNTIQIVNTNTGEQVTFFDEPEYDPFTQNILTSEKKYGISSLLFSKKNTYLMIGSIDGTVHLWKNYPWRYEGHLDTLHNRAVTHFAMNDNEDFLASSSCEDSHIIMHKGLRHHTTLRQTHPTCLLFLPGSNILVSGSIDGKIRIWDSESGSCIHTLATDQNNNAPITSLCVAKNGTHLIAGHNTGQLDIWTIQISPELLIIKN